MPRILLTAFEPFDKNKTNYSLEILNELEIKDKVILPVIFFEASNILLKKLKNYNYCLMLGEARSRTKISLEKVAINYIDARIPDNSNKTINNQLIIPNGPDAYFSNIDIYSLFDSLKCKENISVSYSAGTFVCNELYYRVLNQISKNKLPTKALFIHIPNLENLSKEDVKNAIDEII
ncbi:hypothetical protein LJC17_04690, partial [Acholeplasma sp. OttesenSCG-928-E16]|nr:hypothetical protein [Acholeplasma sp. OttesenSCG-928-E16]